MERRRLLYAVAAAGALALAGCTTTGQGVNDQTPTERRAKINAGADDALARLYSSVPGAREMGAKARGILIFPQVVSAGFVIGGEYGEGVLRQGGSNNGYYRVAGGSFGFQAGAQSRAVIIMFMNEAELDRFKNASGWTAGVDGSVAVAKVGVNGGIDSNTARAPVVAFALTNAGLMANLTVQGSKITKLDL
ncbi:lipoprotein [Pigmentiphaga soli]|uniref:Lipoprotein n=1 Tax=Pigmentiphaga soli TaxID=1007095 RepID=A0ABP8HGN1_9BURK